MYIIFERESGIIQFSFFNYKENTLIRGIFIQNIEEKMFTCNNNYFLLLNELSLRSVQVLDFRFVFKNKILKEIFFFLFYSLFCISKFIHKIIANCFFQKFFICTLALFYFFDFGRSQNISFGNIVQNDKDFLVWKNHFKKSKTAQKISYKKHSFLSDKIPQIRGIWDFKVIPLTAKSHSDENYNGFIAVPYSTLISIQANNNTIKKPIEDCHEKELHVFKISEKDELLLLESVKLISRQKKEHFILFSEIELKKYEKKFPNICSYIVEHAGESF